MVGLKDFSTLKLHKEFQHIYNKGKSAHSDSLVLFFLNAKETRKIGFTATKKIGNAVKRNRAKRRLRALFCIYSDMLKNGNYIFVAKQITPDTPYQKLKRDFEKVLKISDVIKRENSD